MEWRLLKIFFLSQNLFSKLRAIRKRQKLQNIKTQLIAIFDPLGNYGEHSFLWLHKIGSVVTNQHNSSK